MNAGTNGEKRPEAKASSAAEVAQPAREKRTRVNVQRAKHDARSTGATTRLSSTFARDFMTSLFIAKVDKSVSRSSSGRARFAKTVNKKRTAETIADAEAAQKAITFATKPAKRPSDCARNFRSSIAAPLAPSFAASLAWNLAFTNSTAFIASSLSSALTLELEPSRKEFAASNARRAKASKSVPLSCAFSMIGSTFNLNFTVSPPPNESNPSTNGTPASTMDGLASLKATWACCASQPFAAVDPSAAACPARARPRPTLATSTTRPTVATVANSAKPPTV
mmetsp:Transcript_21074/g.65066  ORF Transcript_21074/g.65066 Transcript_21074/m.65066 type:complete len:281 (+) Transcript_21074:757-1599(+)